MTLDEAIKHAEKVMVENLEKTKGRNASDPIAINCFECAEEQKQLAEWLRDYKRLLEQEPCEDVIRREDALQALCNAVHKNDDTIPCPNQRVSCLWSKTKVQDYAEEIYKLSPVTPKPTKPKTSHWVYKIYGGFHEQGDWYCSHCDYQFNYRNGHAKYCPECGYEMSEPPTEEVIGDRDYDWVIRR